MASDNRAKYGLTFAEEQPSLGTYGRRRSRKAGERASRHNEFGPRDSGDGVDRQNRSGISRSCYRRIATGLPGNPGIARCPGARISGDITSDRCADWYRHVAARSRSGSGDQDNRREIDMMRVTRDEDAALRVHAYVDGELDPANALGVEASMAADPALAAERERIEIFRCLVREHLPPEEPPLGLRARVEAAVGMRRPRMQPSWRALAASIAVTAVVASGATSMLVAPSG